MLFFALPLLQWAAVGAPGTASPAGGAWRILELADELEHILDARHLRAVVAGGVVRSLRNLHHLGMMQKKVVMRTRHG